jgi:hypothetical protein
MLLLAPLPFAMGMGTGLLLAAAPAAAGRSTEEYLSSSSICQGAEDSQRPALGTLKEGMNQAGCQCAGLTQILSVDRSAAHNYFDKNQRIHSSTA